MKPSDFIITLIFCSIPFILFALIVGFRGGWNAGIRILLLGLGVLLGGTILIAMLGFFLPDWFAVAFLYLLAFLPWLSTLRYSAMKMLGGKSLMTIRDDEKWSMSIMSGAILIMLGLMQFINPNHIMSISKSYSLGICLFSLGIYRALKNTRYTQITEQGILYENGNFYRWDNISGYTWKFGEDKCSLKLRKSLLKGTVNLKIPSRFRHEIVAYLAQNVSNQVENVQPEPLPAKNAD